MKSNSNQNLSKIRTLTTPETLGSSFRDPSGFLFKQQGEIFRQINLEYRNHYDHLMSSGLYQYLVEHTLMLTHKEIEIPPPDPITAYKIIKPNMLDFVSYPYEWCFSQLKHAALTTLRLQRNALKYGMCLKDASAYNIQFHHGKPVLIDSLSFETYIPGKPWIAYRQFCQHFLAPLSLAAYRDIRLFQLTKTFIDGIPLDLTSRLLPNRSRFSVGVWMHIHLHAKSQQKYANQKIKSSNNFNLNSMLGLIDSLENTVNGMKWKLIGAGWESYYHHDHNYSPNGLKSKEKIIHTWLKEINPTLVWDLGANTGKFSRIASQQNMRTLAFDIDPAAVEINYQQCLDQKETYLLPLVMDFTNPSPALGWQHRERLSLEDRGPANALLALALIHHLAIGNNVPLDRLAQFFSRLGKWLIIEFIPKEDSQVQRLLSYREDIFSSYNQATFEKIFSNFFKIHKVQSVHESLRNLYLMENRLL